MKQRRRIYYTETQKALMWERWRKGVTLHQIARMRACARQTIKQVEVGQRSCDCRDFLIEHVDRSERCAWLGHQHQRE